MVSRLGDHYLLLPANVRYDGLAQPGSYSDWFTKAPATLGASGRIEIPAHGYRVFVGDNANR